MRESSTSSEFEHKLEVQSRLPEIRSALESQQGARNLLVSQRESLHQDIEAINERIENLKLIETYLAQFADERQAQVYQQIEATVTEGLRSVFDEDLRLEVSTKLVGSRSETVFTLVSHTDKGELRTSIMDARGGGVAAIVGFLIQAVLVLLTPNLRPIIFLDETFRNVSEEYQAPLGEFIKGLCERTGLQVVLVTHQPTIADYADVWYSFSYSDGRTKIKRVV